MQCNATPTSAFIGALLIQLRGIQLENSLHDGQLLNKLFMQLSSNFCGDSTGDILMAHEVGVDPQGTASGL